MGSFLTSSSVQSAREERGASVQFEETEPQEERRRERDGERERTREGRRAGGGRTTPQHVGLEALDLLVEVVEERRAPARQVGAELVGRVGRGVGAVLGDESLREKRENRSGSARRRQRKCRRGCNVPEACPCLYNPSRSQSQQARGHERSDRRPSERTHPRGSCCAPPGARRRTAACAWQAQGKCGCVHECERQRRVRTS